ncbi:hypothetical protein TIN4_85 [Tsukamurella phage TIN4]|uniref:Uncharacterized protein n=2 Tax=Tinduovirus TIN3 TaxID=1982571 RepID=A0A0K0N5W4_9CAUD|nr:hypothetical protein AVT54_gp040 [Tsukamurella phage TIN3]YP_009604215.1 hypothetical protein FDH87_gp040 [Tsukamurella phage TIN4]AKJ71882.1 hypothetical protein TIN3_85 [Tsukamurella phage TIN3]AKJ71991.1 hypothetical protein TIN4_85 [Tsukamurella phage TIN4]
MWQGTITWHNDTKNKKRFSGQTFWDVRKKMDEALNHGERLVRTLECDAFTEYDVFSALSGMNTGTAIAEEVLKR